MVHAKEKHFTFWALTELLYMKKKRIFLYFATVTPFSIVCKQRKQTTGEVPCSETISKLKAGKRLEGTQRVYIHAYSMYSEALPPKIHKEPTGTNCED